MPSQRNDISAMNKNDSKNTRMDFEKLSSTMDYRKDEVMHIGRYTCGAQTISDIAKKLKRPIRVLDIGCGEMNTARLFYKVMREKKSETLAEYVGIDIDFIMAEKAVEKYQRAFEKCNARYSLQDLTTDSKIKFPDGYFDLIVCYEFMEHVQPIFIPDILDEAYRVLSKNGKALFSTPNSNGSNKKLPKDHIYEYSYQECIDLFSNAGFEIEDAVGVCINFSKIPDAEKETLEAVIGRYWNAFGRNAPFADVAIAPLFDPVYCKNVLYHLGKR